MKKCLRQSFSAVLALSGLLLQSPLQSAETNAPQKAAPRTAKKQSIGIPAYFYPTAENLPLWDRVRSGHPAVSIVIATGLGLEGTAPDPNYQVQMTKTRKAGIRVLAYVTTSYGTKELSKALKEIDNAFAWYDIDGIFFDEAVRYPVTTAQVEYHAAMHKYVKCKDRRAITVINHGQILPEEYAAVCDIMMNAEMSYESYLKEWSPWGWESRYPASKFWHIIHSVDTVEKMEHALKLSKERNARYVFVTSPTMESPGGPYGTLPSNDYWNAEIAAISAKKPAK
jgi:hypothetical protein